MVPSKVEKLNLPSKTKNNLLNTPRSNTEQAVNSGLTTFESQLAREVLRLRYWQHLINERLKEGEFNIPIHVAIGNEAIAVAVSNMMEPDDQLVLSHRNMAYNLARCGSLEPIYREFLLSPAGAAQGQLGSMNLANSEWGTVYTSSILGNNVPVACGLALGKQTNNESGVVIVLMGDGSIEEGAFYESLVFSKTFALPLVMIIENNDQSMSSTIAQRRSPISLGDMCSSVDIPYIELKGNNVWDYYDALRLMRPGVARGTPVCIEVHVKAMNNHAGPTPGWPTDPLELSLDNGLGVERTSNDPVFELEERIDPAELAEITSQIMAEEGTGLPV